MRLYVVFSEVEEHLPHILGIFTDKETAYKVRDIDNSGTETRAIVKEFESDTVFVTHEDELKFKVCGLTTKIDEDGRCYDAMESFLRLGGPDSWISEDENGNVIETKIIKKTRNK